MMFNLLKFIRNDGNYRLIFVTNIYNEHATLKELNYFEALPPEHRIQKCVTRTNVQSQTN